MVSHVVILTALVLAAQSQIALPPEKEKWVRVESPHFTVISTASESETFELAQRMETLALVLQNLHPRFREQPLMHSRVLLFDERAEAQPYFELLLSRGTTAAGHSSPRRTAALWSSRHASARARRTTSSCTT